MVNKTKKTTSKKKPSPKKADSSFVKKLLGAKYYLIICLILVVVGALAFRSTSISSEKKDFLTKQQKLEEIADRIAAANKPDTRESYQYCRYQSGKLERGELYCHVGIKISYASVDAKMANRIMLASANVASPSPIINQLKPDFIIFTNTPDSQSSHFSQAVLEDSRCRISYNYPVPNEDVDNLVVFLSCSSISRAEHFPLEK